jgi:SAM-dependent methyltransferase
MGTAKTTFWLKKVMEMAGDFHRSRILLTAVELDIFNQLGKRRMTAAELALRLKAAPRATTILLNALTSLGLLRKKGETYSNTASGGRFLVRESPHYRGAFLVHMARSWNPWQELTKVVKSGEAAPHEGPADAAAFAWAMYDLGLERAEEVASLLDLEKVRKALDLGGGPGHYAAALAERCPACVVTVFDMPDILKVTEEVFSRHPELKPRLRTMAGDFLVDDIGSGYDLIVGSSIIHSYGEENARAIIQKAAGALAVGGQLAIHDFLLDDSMTRPAEAAVFAVHMLIMTGVGRSYSVSEISRWMEEAGLSDCRRLPVGTGATSLLIAKRNS